MKCYYIKILYSVLLLLTSNINAQIDFNWAQSWGGGGSDISYNVTVREDFVYIVGEFVNILDFVPGTNADDLETSGSWDGFFAKFDLEGNFIFARKAGGIGIDASFSIALDSEENIYMAGIFEATANFGNGLENYYLTSNGDYDGFLAKYDAEGNLIFARNMGGVSYDQCIAVTTDLNNNVFVTGIFYGTSDFDPGIEVHNLYSDILIGGVFLVKYDEEGNFLYANSATGDVAEVYPSTVATDSHGNAIIIGTYTDVVSFYTPSDTVTLTPLEEETYFVKYDSTGHLVFATTMGQAGGYIYGQTIAVDSDDNIFIAGSFTGDIDFDVYEDTHILSSNSSGDIFFAKYNSNGNLLFVKALEGMDFWEHVHDITLDHEGNIYIAGQFGSCDFDPGPSIFSMEAGFDDSADIFFAKYDSEGNLVYVNSYGVANIDVAHGIALDEAENIYLTGSFNDNIDFYPGYQGGELFSNSYDDIFLVKFSQETTLASQPIHETSSSLRISPNPTTAITSITSFNHLNNATIILTTATGDIAKTWYGQTGTDFTIDFTGLPAGVYWITVADETQVASGRVVVLR